MVDREAEEVTVETVDIPTGTITIKAATQENIQGLKTILHPTPTGMIIQGLRSESKLRVVLLFKTLLFVPLISQVCLGSLTCVEI